MEAIIKKRRKRKDYVLMLSENVSEEEAYATVEDIRKELVKVFRYHIGEENAITPVNLFIKVYGVNPNEIDVFRRNYMWNVVKTILKQLRNDDTMFVINKGTKLFVLKTEPEKVAFKKRMDRNIEQLKSLKVKADEWVDKKKYSRL